METYEMTGASDYLLRVVAADISLIYHDSYGPNSPEGERRGRGTCSGVDL